MNIMDMLPHMILPFIVVVLVLIYILGILGPVSSRKNDGDSTPFIYKQLDSLFTPSERSFYGVLISVSPKEYTVFAKVRIADILTPDTKDNKSDWRTLFNKISSKHFDFVICNNETLKPLAAIELDDKSHVTKRANRRDMLVNEACSSAKFSLIRIDAKAAYVPEIIFQKVFLQLVEKPELDTPQNRRTDKINQKTD